jgi:flagellar biosynthesis anti-sigma factor FlgM
MHEMRVRNAGAATPITPIAGYSRPAAAADGVDDSDATGISERARELGRALEAVEASPADREMRIKALRAAIQNGTYKLDAGEVARRLLDNGF